MLAALVLALASDPGALAEREWNQPFGNAAGSAWFDVEPVVGAPTEAWSVTLRSIDCEPVTWGGLAYVVADEGQGRRVVAYALADGSRVCSAPLSGRGPVTLVASDGVVLAVERTRILPLVRRGKDLKPQAPIAGEWTGTPALGCGVLLVERAGGTIAAIEAASGRVVGELPGRGRAAIAFEKEGHARVAFARTTARDEIGLATARLAGLGTAKLAFEAGPAGPGLALSDPVSTFDARATFVERPLGGRLFVWHLECGAAIETGRDEAASGFFSPAATTSFARAPAAVRGVLYGFDAAGTLVARTSAAGSARELVAAESRPRGARVHAASAARDVVYLGNWAVDLESKRVLWTLPDLDPVGPLEPVGDRSVLCVTRDRRLVLLSDALAQSASSTRTAGPPGSGDALVLASGERIAGDVDEPAPGRWRVVTSGAPDASRREFDAREIALVEQRGAAKLLGTESALERAFWSALAQEHRARLTVHFERCRTAGAIDECRSVLAALARFDLDRAGRDALVQRLGSRQPGIAVDVAACAREWQALDELAADRFEASAVWCIERGWTRAASALLLVASELAPGRASAAELAAKLVPPGFPAASDPAAPNRWLTLARAILPSDARVVPADDPARARAAGEHWKGDVLALRTRNVLLFSRELDPAIVGECLQRAQLGVAALEREFLPGAPAGAPMVVFLHEDRAAYLAEEPPGGSPAPEWSAGYYDPHEGVSRFHVVRGENREPLRRGLAQVFSHELTHHWVSQRWLGTDAAPAHGAFTSPGFWVVEGFARYVEDQVVDLEPGRRERFGREDARSLEAVVQLSGQKKLIPLHRFVDLTQRQFHELGNDLRGIVRPRSSLEDLRLSERSIFYEEAGALVFFLAHASGERGRAALKTYVEAWYGEKADVEGWKALGWETADALQADFDAFLARLAAR